MHDFRDLIKKFSPLLVAFILMALYVSSCRAGLLTPAEPFLSGRRKPVIPKQIATGERQEPVISVYIAEKETVEQMNMEEYVTGVVAGEMDPNWPLAALAAQAILARTFTLQKIAEMGGVPARGTHASTDIEEFQAYSAEDINDQVREAVRLTRGVVAVHRNQFIRAWFSAYAGPKTALAPEGLDFKNNPPYIQSVDNPGQKIVPKEEGEWAASFTREEVQDAVEEATGADPGPVDTVEIVKYGPSGRAVTFQINGQKVSGPGLRLALGSTQMRSTLVQEMNLDEEMLHMSGVGYGHGVGMCQWGARALAEEKHSPEEIVNYFYKDISTLSLWD